MFAEWTKLVKASGTDEERTVRTPSTDALASATVGIYHRGARATWVSVFSASNLAPLAERGARKPVGRPKQGASPKPQTLAI